MLALLLAVTSAGAAQAHKPLPLHPGHPGEATNHRLILKDGTYQVVRKYEIVGNRVHYTSLERAGDREELPVALVDWEATRKWELDQAAAIKEVSAGMEEADENDEQQALRPEVAKDLDLPDEDTVFALDTFDGKPELVELVPVDLAMNGKQKLGPSTLNPLSAAKASLELDGAHAKVHLHVSDPAIYIALDSLDDAEQVISHAQTVKIGGASEGSNREHGAHSPASGFAIMRADEHNTVRVLGDLHVSSSGAVTQDENVIPAKVEVLPGKHWLKITPNQPLATGEYALVEILSASEINQSVWDFRIDPQSGGNAGSIGPIVK
jgi:hypothetical protein